VNTNFVCVDANLIVRLLLDPVDEAVKRLWERWEVESRQPVAPTLLRYEVINAFHQYRRARLMDAAALQAAVDGLLALAIQAIDDVVLHEQALDLAERFALSAAYDAHYLALAQHLDIEFWTGDGRLANAVGSDLPWVHLLGK
jgi:predicted nucleic acid-binding protein